MLVFAVPFLPAIHETVIRFPDKVVRADAYPALRRNRAADVKTDTHSHSFDGHDKRSLDAMMRSSVSQAQVSMIRSAQGKCANVTLPFP
jgi:hypothetical protein